MPAKRARRLVVDASVAVAAGGRTAAAPTATRCRDFLEALRQETHYHIVLPPNLNDEWQRHMTPFASRWLRAMARRGRVVIDDVPPSNKMRREIESVAARKKSEVDALRKDFHLVEAAIAHDRTVVSRDELVRRLFKAAARSVVAIKKVVWVNPVNAAERPLAWLRGGAKAEQARMLGYVEPEA